MAAMLSKASSLIIMCHERGYRVDHLGVVTNPRGEPIRTGADKWGYKSFTTKMGGIGPTRVYVHRLVAYDKFGDAMFAPGVEVRHLDGNSLNNAPSNIETGTHLENTMDVPEGERVRRAKIAASKLRKLSKADAGRLREDKMAGASYDELTKKYGVAKSTVSYIVNRKTYR